MNQFTRIKQLINKCEDPMEMIGLINGIEAAALIYCKKNYPDEVFNEIDCECTKVSIVGIKYYLESSCV